MSARDPALQNVMDRLDILDLFARYCHAVDNCDLSMFPDIFTDDVEADYSTVAEYTQPLNPVRHGLAELIAYFEVALPPMGKGLTHYMSNHLIELDGDTATITVHNHVLNLAQGGVYHTRARRTAKGWRLDRLVFEVRYFADVSARMNGHMQKIDGRTC